MAKAKQTKLKHFKWLESCGNGWHYSVPIIHDGAVIGEVWAEIAYPIIDCEFTAYVSGDDFTSKVGCFGQDEKKAKAAAIRALKQTLRNAIKSIPVPAKKRKRT